MSHETEQTLLEKWEPVLNEASADEIKDPHRRKVTAVLLENTEKYLPEAVSVAGSIGSGPLQGWDPVLVSMVRRMAPKLIAYDFLGVQPMTMPTGLLFCLRATSAGTPPNTAPQGGAEILAINEADTGYSGTGTHAGNNPFSGTYTTGVGKAREVGETDPWASVGIKIDKASIAAGTRQLRADYSIELAQDLKRVHGLDAEGEMINVLTNELVAELNREVVRTTFKAAKVGAQFASTPGTFDLTADADGRWSAERFKGLWFAIERDANKIALESRRGKGNFLIVSSDVASALAMAGILDYAPVLAGMTSLDVDATGATYAGTAGRFKVYVDPYLGADGYLVGYKGASSWDAGIYYAPYIPLELFRATDPSNFSSAIGFKSRYAIAENPFVGNSTNVGAGVNFYYRKAAVSNIL
jgi:hypothetical protein